MAVLVGVFENQTDAERAYLRLREAGVVEDNLALISNARGAGVATSAAELDAERSAEAASGSDDVEVRIAGANSPSIAPAEALDLGPPDDDDEQRRAQSHGGPPEAVVESKSEDSGMDSAALGAAIGAVAGGGMAGPLGVIAGIAAGGAIGAALAMRGLPKGDADSYEEALRQGRYLVAVEADEPTPEMRAILDVAGASSVKVA